MDWLSWLEKKKVQLSIAGWNEEEKPKKKVPLRMDDDKGGAFDDSGFYKKASWETWLEKNDPCWEGYEQYGMKDKDGKKVPNCVKKADESKPLNKPMRDDGNKKFKVFVRDPSTGNIVTVRFGDPNMEIKRDNPERRSSFRARHKCSEQKDITSAAYWSCKMWEKTSSVSDNINKSNWELWLEKNNAIETSHKEDEKKHEWDGKFSSSTIRDDVKDDDDKAVSEEEPLDELTDGKLEEVEKLKSWELWLKKTTNQFDKQPQKKRTIDGAGEVLDTNAGIVQGRQTETVPVPNPKGSIGKKRVKRVNHETGKKEIKYIDRENNTNSEVENTSGGRPISGKQGSINATAGGKGKVTLENTIQMLNSVLGDENKPTGKNESQPAVPSTPETPEQRRKRLIQATFRKKKPNLKNAAWESWLEKGRWDTGKKENKFIDSLQAVGTMANEENNRSMKVIDDEIEHGVKPSNITSEPIKMPKKKVPSKDVDNRLNVLEAHKIKSWEGWLEKMQGAGDARFGNQHLTGLDQKPVNNEEDEANILPEKEEKTNNKDEKQEKTEDKEGKDNKPYKALS